MRKTILAALSGAILTAVTAQATLASEHHQIRTTTNHAAASEKFRNSQAYVAPDIAVQSAWSGYDGALGSGMAGH